MNLTYEKLFTAFLEKAKVDRDANQIVTALRQAYPNCNLPVPKTIKRLITGETSNPRESLLGFLAAFVLEIPETEVVEADQKNRLGDFYKTFAEQTETWQTVTNMPPSVETRTIYKVTRIELYKTIKLLSLQKTYILK